MHTKLALVTLPLALVVVSSSRSAQAQPYGYDGYGFPPPEVAPAVPPPLIAPLPPADGAAPEPTGSRVGLHLAVAASAMTFPAVSQLRVSPHDSFYGLDLEAGGVLAPRGPSGVRFDFGGGALLANNGAGVSYVQANLGAQIGFCADLFCFTTGPRFGVMLQPELDFTFGAAATLSLSLVRTRHIDMTAELRPHAERGAFYGTCISWTPCSSPTPYTAGVDIGLGVTFL